MFVCLIVFQLIVFSLKLLSSIDTFFAALIFPWCRKSLWKAELLKGRRILRRATSEQRAY
jgi:hypothetical protein